jgi:hypothetical protein
MLGVDTIAISMSDRATASSHRVLDSQSRIHAEGQFQLGHNGHSLRPMATNPPTADLCNLHCFSFQVSNRGHDVLCRRLQDHSHPVIAECQTGDARLVLNSFRT